MSKALKKTIHETNNSDNEIFQKFQETNKVIKPWGSYVILDKTPGHVVKKISINPNQKISLQYHNHRREEWFIVSGSGFAELGKEKTVINLPTNSSLTILEKQLHRITANEEGVQFIEIQHGTVVDENDIVRIEDLYGRVI
jgi:mannose-6-phosphate isomerase-like protein (cupin superfamily)